MVTFLRLRVVAIFGNNQEEVALLLLKTQEQRTGMVSRSILLMAMFLLLSIPVPVVAISGNKQEAVVLLLPKMRDHRIGPV
jgi:hypothetical protein